MTPTSGEPVQFSFVSTEAGVFQMRDSVLRLLEKTGASSNRALSPDYYLWQIQDQLSAPAVMFSRDQNELVSVLYGAERRVFGIPTGIVAIGDSVGECVVIAPDAEFVNALTSGIASLLGHWRVHTIRLKINIADHLADAIAANLAQRPRLGFSGVRRRASHRLQLEDSYEGFLAALGPGMRENFRRYSRRAVAAGLVKQILTLSEVSAALAYLQPRSSHRKTMSSIQADLAAFKLHPDSMAFGMRKPCGEWVSVVGGWRGRDRFSVLFQLNHSGYPNQSLSTVMRLHMIQELITQGVREIQFSRGCAGFWTHICSPDQYYDLIIEKKHWVWNLLTGWAAGLFRNRFPCFSELKGYAAWDAPRAGIFAAGNYDVTGKSTLSKTPSSSVAVPKNRSAGDGQWRARPKPAA